MPGKKLFLINSRYPFVDTSAATISVPFDAEQTASLYQALLLDTIDRLSQIPDVAIRVMAANEAEMQHLGGILDGVDVDYFSGDTVGDKYANAAEEAFNNGIRQIFIIDSAVPTVPVRIIQSGLSLLEVFEDTFAIAPIERGGFYAVGMNGYHAEVLRGVDPTTAEGYETVIARICEFDASVYILNSWYDIRQLEDVIQLRGELLNTSENGGPAKTMKLLDTLQIEALIDKDSASAES